MTNEESRKEETAAVAVRSQIALSMQEELSVDQVLNQVKKVQQIMAAVMRKDEHYGIIPGCKKPSLYQPGAQKLCFTFRLRPEFEEREVAINRPGIPPGHIDVVVKCRLIHIATGNPVAEGIGSCSTLEAKYRYRGESRKCPQCGAEAIIKGKDEYGGGWLCYKKKEGCGAKFKDGDPAIESQAFGKIENPDLADIYNTVRKMAKKRAYVDATLTGTAASDIFTQDVEDFGGNGEEPIPPESDDHKQDKKKRSSKSSGEIQSKRESALDDSQADENQIRDLYGIAERKEAGFLTNPKGKTMSAVINDYLASENRPAKMADRLILWAEDEFAKLESAGDGEPA